MRRTARQLAQLCIAAALGGRAHAANRVGPQEAQDPSTNRPLRSPAAVTADQLNVPGMRRRPTGQATARRYSVVFFGFRATLGFMKELADLISTGEAARLLGCSRQHVVDLCERGVLPFVSAGSHRRVRRVDVTGLMRSELTRDQERSLWLHRVVAGHLALDPQAVLTLAARNLEHLGQVHPRGMTAQWLDQWQKVLDSGEDAVFGILTSPSPHAVELRQNSPFAGVLSDQERAAVLEAFRNHWRQAHAA
jgi:excisionase family DNA binding protein